MTDLKERIFEDLAPRAAFAAAIGKSERTVVRLKLPTTYIGREPYIIVSKARAKLMGEPQPIGIPKKRKVGRPRQAA